MWIEIILFMIALAFLNRVRGGGFGAERLPFSPRYVIWVAVAALALWHFRDWRAAAFTGMIVAWSLIGWGDYFTFGNPPAAYRAQHTRAQSWSFFLCIGAVVAMAVIVMQASLAACIAAALFGPVSCLAYELGWHVQRKQGVTFTDIAEPIIGGWWGLMLALA